MKIRSLNKKLLLSVVMISLSIAIMASLFSFISELERSKLQSKSMLNQLLDTVEDTAAIAVYSKNKQIAEDVLKGLLKNDIVYKAHIKSEQGFDIELSRQDVTSDEPPIKRSLKSPFGDDEILGYLFVQPSAKFKLVEAEHTAMSNALISIIIITVTSLTIFLIFRSNISKPLTHVSDTLHAIQVGKKQRIPEIKTNKHNELGRLVFDINNLLEVLEHKYNEEFSLRKKVESIEQQLRNIFNSTSAGLFLLDEKGLLLTFNKTFKNILQNSASDISKSNSLLSSCFFEQQEFNDLLLKVLKTGRLETQDFSLQQVKNTQPVWVHCLLSKVIDESLQTHIEGVIFDVTKRVESENATAYDANHDKLTGLLRRQAAQEAYQYYMKNAGKPSASFLFLDLDGFKQANDTYGHLAGDKVLVITSQRLVECIRETDILCRLGGDEFLIILMNCSNDNTYRISKNIIATIQKTYAIDNDINIKIGVSMGIAHLDNQFKDFDILLQIADTAMYEVKRNGKNGYCVNGHSEIHKALLKVN